MITPVKKSYHLANGNHGVIEVTPAYTTGVTISPDPIKNYLSV